MKAEAKSIIREATEIHGKAAAMIVAVAHATSGAKKDAARKAILKLWGMDKFRHERTGAFLTVGDLDEILEIAYHEYSAFESS